ncbi:MlaA family lipoprotein [Vibrio sp. L5-1]|uniref:ABC transporter n=1 Tax=Vibrio splendidus TaxID=29497 RepID=A0A837NQR5_VIBSP|nr:MULTISPECIES: MlaA family lipoprotein [Vibrio]KPL92735.1 ABC transporter [Vibrio splendidus]MCF7495538.1 MlaA family lipoprotein [Vibrio sp. L5-1]NOJ10475.1 VacJ family lipoprotein [Vibrio splendidus]
MSVSVLRLSSLLFIASLTVGCSSAPDESTNDNNLETSEYVEESHPNDPFEGFNRAMWDINYEYLDPYLVRPVSLAYVGYTPVPVRSGISNFLANLDEPASMVNNLFMGNGEKALDHFNRFWINSTFGLLGLIDIASEAGITKYDDKSFSDAIGHYGVGNGPYFMVPGYGPITTREVTEQVDSLYVPLSLISFWASLGKWAFEGMETRAQLVSQEALLDDSPDPYALTREVYIQRRDFKAEIEPEEVDLEEEDFIDGYLEDY